MTAAPPVTDVTITATPLDTTSSTLTAKAKPGGSFDLGNVDSTEPYTFDVTGATAAGEIVVQGRSLAIAPDDIDGSAYPIFCQRVDAWARPPDGLVSTHVGGMAAIGSEQFLFLAGGSKVENANGAAAETNQADFYDFATLAGGTGKAPLPFSPKTVVGLGDSALLIDDTEAGLQSFDDGGFTKMTLPSGLDSFGDVAGGRPLVAPDGRTFVLGATRAATATAAVLAIGTDDSLAAFALSHPRAGAAAAWVDGVGLVVAAGSAEAPGVELLPDGDSEFVTRPFPSDRTTGAAIGANSSGVFLVGGVVEGANAATRRIDPGCTSGCNATEVPELALPVALVDTQVFQLAGERLLVVGNEADGGHARTFELDVGKKVVTEIKLREPRTGASFTAAPNGTLAVLGGLHDDGTPAISVETLFPR